MADELKAKGNAAFSAGNHEEAIKHFSDAIELDPTNHVLFSNRSASQASLKNFDEALKDAKQCVALKADWPKGYSRLGGALYGLQDWDACLEAYQKGLDIDPSNALLQTGLRDAEAAKNKPAGGAGGGMFGPEFVTKLAMNPETRAYLSQPDFMEMLRSLNTNPGSMTSYLGDPRFQKALSVGMGLNMSMPGANGFDDMEGGDMGGDEAGSRAPPAAARPQPPQPRAPVDPDAGLSDEDKALRAKKAEAVAEKEAGNKAYKAKDFDVAIEHYSKAIEINDKDISFITNRAAAKYEKGDLDAAIEDCVLAVEKGREVRPVDFKFIGKAMTRHGTCLAKQGKLLEAVEMYNKALTESRNADTLELRNATERKLKAQQQEAYCDLAKAEEEKELGNAAFKAGDNPTAVAHYTEALKRGPADKWPEAYKVYSNRAACYTKLLALSEGEKDADMCIKLAPTFAKGYSRKGAIKYLMKEYEKGLEVYTQGLVGDPESKELRDGAARCQAAINRFMRGDASEDEIKERQAKAMADPEIQSIISDPIVQQVLKEMGENPRAASQHMKNPAISGKLQRLMAAGIIQMR